MRTLTLLASFICCGFGFAERNWKKELKGEWLYHYSILEGEQTKLQTDDHQPVFKIAFKDCVDSLDMKRLPQIVRNMRKGNALQNLCYRTYNDSLKLIETYFPVARIYEDSARKFVQIVEYGYRLKDDYLIEGLNGDTLIIGGHKCYPHKGKQCVTAKHVYVRKR